jgi:two-component system, NtrC family, response regulator AtoC
VTVRPLPDSGFVVIGRDPTCEAFVDDESVSRRHCRLHCGEQLSVEDLGSKNGTRLHGRRLAAGDPVPLSIGSVLELGDAVAFVRNEVSNVAIAPRVVAARSRAREGLLDRTARPVIVQDPRMLELYDLIDVIAPSPFSVLILGETGVGKDVYAETIHHRSSRANASFLRLNCAALAESILEAELFGYEKGAFTGAVTAKAGLFESADGGTVFLDEVGDMPASTQAKLLRVLENGEVLRLGSHKTRKVDIRVVAATNRDLRALADRNEFRSDLYFRIAGVVVTLPALRERPDELIALANHFAAEACRRLGKPEATLSSAAIAAIRAHRWPGNIRELRNVLERAALLTAEGVIEPVHLGELKSRPSERADDSIAPSSGSFRGEVRDLERRRIVEALESCAWNQSRAAEILGIPRRTFVKRLDAYGITRPRKREP